VVFFVTGFAVLNQFGDVEEMKSAVWTGTAPVKPFVYHIR